MEGLDPASCRRERSRTYHATDEAGNCRSQYPWAIVEHALETIQRDQGPRWRRWWERRRGPGRFQGRREAQEAARRAAHSASTLFFNNSAELLGRFNQIEKLLLTNR